MLRSLAVLLVAAFIASSGSAIADPQYNANTLPTLSIFNKSGGATTVQLHENGVLKGNFILSKSTSYVQTTLRATVTMSGTVDVNGKIVAIAPRSGVALVAGRSINISVVPVGSGFAFANGP
jgi:hypothetical protein